MSDLDKLLAPEDLAAMWERAAEDAPERARQIGVDEFAHEAKRDRLALLYYTKALQDTLAERERSRFVPPELRNLRFEDGA